MTERLSAFLAVLLGLALLVGVFHNGVFIHSDLGDFHLPLKRLYAAALNSGHIPLWYPEIYNGYYLHGEGQLGMLHPFHLLIYKFLPFQAAFNLDVLAAFPVAYLGMRFFCANVDALSPLKNTTALFFSLNGFLLMHIVHPNIVLVVAHTPWLLWCIQKASQDGRRIESAVTTSLLVGSMILLGHPQSVALSLLTALLFALCAHGGSWRQWAFPFCMGIVGGIGFGTPQWLPTMDVYLSSMRPEMGRSFHHSWSLHPAWLVYTVLPYPFRHFYNEYTVYQGAIIPFLAVLYLMLPQKNVPKTGDRGLKVFCIMASVLGLWLAFGKYGYLYKVLQYIPVVNGFRSPARYSFLFSTALAIGAGLGFRLMCENLSAGQRFPRAFKMFLFVWLAASFLIAATLVFIQPEEGFAILGGASVFWLTVSASLAFLASVLVVIVPRWLPAGTCLVVLFFVCDMSLFAWKSGHLKSMPLDEYIKIHSPPITGENWKIESTDNRYVMSGHAISGGYSAMPPVSRKGLSADELMFWGIGWIKGTDHGWKKLAAPEKRYRLEGAGVPAPSGGDIAVLEDSGTRRVLLVSSAGNADLVWAENFHPGWKAFRRDVPADVLKHSSGGMAIFLPPGNYELSLVFQPLSYEIGFWAGILTFVLMVFAWLYKYRGYMALRRPVQASWTPS